MKKTLTKISLVLLLLAVLAALPLVTQGKESWAVATGLSDGETYMFVYSGSITDGAKKTFGVCALKSVEANQYGLAYADRPVSSVSDDFLWTVEAAGNGKYYFKSEANGKYLNMTAGPNGKGSASLENTPQALNVSIQGGNMKISAELGGSTYYIRFTTSYHKTEGSCWESGTGTNSNEFRIYQKMEAAAEFEESGSPYFSVACFSDLHIDYGIQSSSPHIRGGTIRAAQYVQEFLGGAHVVLVGGDITSNNDYNKSIWNTTLIRQCQQAVYDTMSLASKDGKVLLVAGNHDYEAGTMSQDGDVYNSADYSRYMTEALGPYDAALYQEDLNPSYGKHNELLGYRYRVGGIDFIGINTPYRTGKVDGGLFRGQITWLDQQLNQLGKDRTVIVLCHYPVNMIPDQAGESGTTQYMQQVLKKYPNVIYCYGHVHGADSYYAWYSASELVLNDGERTRLDNNAYEVEGYITAHMGSMAYYNTQFQSGWLTKDEPMSNHNLMIDCYDDHITFTYYNHGEKSAVDGVYSVASFTVMRDLREQLGLIPSPDEDFDEGDSSSEGSNSGSQGGSSGNTGSSSGNTGSSSGNTGNQSGSSGNPGGSVENPGTSNPDSNDSTAPAPGTDGSADLPSSDCVTPGEDAGEADSSDKDSTENASDNRSDGGEPGSGSSPLPLILGIGAGVLVIGGAALWFFVFRKKKQ